MSDNLMENKSNEEVTSSENEVITDTENVSVNDSKVSEELEKTETDKEKNTESVEEVEAELVTDTELLASNEPKIIVVPEEEKKKSKKPLIIILSGVTAALIIAVVVVLIVLNYKSEEVVNADNKILAIGSVTLDSETKIKEAEDAVNKLKEDDKKKLDNMDKLKEARSEYNKLYNQNEADEIIELIDEIDISKKGRGKDIFMARSAYDSANDDTKKLVKNYNKLTKAEDEYNAADFKSAYDSYCDSTWATLNPNATTLELDTNPSDIEGGSFMGYWYSSKLKDINRMLGLPDSVYNKMSNTRALDGRQTETFGVVEVSWTYHPNQGLEIIYTKE